MVDQFRYFGSKIQVQLGVMETLVPATDYKQYSEVVIDFNPLWDKIKIATGSFTSEPSVRSTFNATVKGKVPFCSKGHNAIPECNDILRAGAFALTQETVTNGIRYHYVRGGRTFADLTFARYSIDTAQMIIDTIYNVMINSLKINLDNGKTPMLEFSGLGCVPASSYKTVATAVDPTQAKITYGISNDLDASILDTSYEAVKASFEFTNKLSQRPRMVGNGFGRCEVAEEESKGNFTITTDTSLGSQPLVRVLSNTSPGAISFEFGSIAGSRISIASSSAQLLTPKESKQGDIISEDIDFDIIDNDVEIIFNADLT